MENIIEREITKMQKEIKGFSVWKDEALFSLVCYKYFFGEGEMSVREAKSIFTDGRQDGGIDLIGLSQNSSGESSLIIVQGKYYEGKLSNFNDIIDIIKKMQRTYIDFSTGANTARYSDTLKRNFREKLDEWENRSEVRFVVFHSATISSNQRIEIQKEIEKDESLRDYIIEIYDKDLIENRIEAVQRDPDCVEKGKILINRV